MGIFLFVFMIIVFGGVLNWFLNVVEVDWIMDCVIVIVEVNILKNMRMIIIFVIGMKFMVVWVFEGVMDRIFIVSGWNYCII